MAKGSSKAAEGKKGGKTTAKSDDAADKQKGGKGGLKAATAVNVRHILCEKHSKATEALQKIQEGQRFDKVAQEYSEDKAKAGGSLGWMTRGSMVVPGCASTHLGGAAGGFSRNTASSHLNVDVVVKTREPGGTPVDSVDTRGHHGPRVRLVADPVSPSPTRAMRHGPPGHLPRYRSSYAAPARPTHTPTHAGHPSRARDTALPALPARNVRGPPLGEPSTPSVGAPNAVTPPRAPSRTLQFQTHLRVPAAGSHPSYRLNGPFALAAPAAAGVLPRLEYMYRGLLPCGLLRLPTYIAVLDTRSPESYTLISPEMSYSNIPDTLSEVVHWRDASKVDLQALDVLTTLKQRQFDTSGTGVVNLTHGGDPDTTTAVWNTLIAHADLDGLASLSHRDSAVRVGVAQSATDPLVRWTGHYLLLIHWVIFTGIGGAWRTMMGVIFMLFGANFESADSFLAETFDRVYDKAAFTLFCTAVLLRRGTDLDPITQLYNRADTDTLDRWASPGEYNPLAAVGPDGAIPSSLLPAKEDLAPVTVYLYWVLLYKGSDAWSAAPSPQRTSTLVAAINDVQALRLAGVSRDELCEAIVSAMHPKPSRADLKARSVSLARILAESALPVGTSLVDLCRAAAVADRIRHDFPSLPWASWSSVPATDALNLVREVTILGDDYHFQGMSNGDVLDLLAREIRNGRADAVRLLLAFELDTRQARRDVEAGLTLEARASAFPSTPSGSHREAVSVPATPTAALPDAAFTPRSQFGLRQLTDNLRVITSSQAPTLTPVATPTSGLAASIHSPLRSSAARSVAATPSTLGAALDWNPPSPVISRIPTPPGISVPSPPDASMIPLPPSRMPSLEPMGPPPAPAYEAPSLPRIDESSVSDESSRIASPTPRKGEQRLTPGARSTLDYWVHAQQRWLDAPVVDAINWDAPMRDDSRPGRPDIAVDWVPLYADGNALAYYAATEGDQAHRMAETAAKFAVDMNGITQVTNFLTHGVQAFPLAWEWLLKRDDQSSASNAAWAAGRFFNEFLRQVPLDQVTACTKNAVPTAATHLALEHDKATSALQSQCREHKARADRLAVEVSRLTKLMDKLTIVDESFGSRVLEMAVHARTAAEASSGIRKDLRSYHVALEARLEPHSVPSYAKATASSNARTRDPRLPVPEVTPATTTPLAEPKTLETRIREVDFRKRKAGAATPTPAAAGPSNRRRTDMPPPPPPAATASDLSATFSVDEHTNWTAVAEAASLIRTLPVKPTGETFHTIQAVLAARPTPAVPATPAGKQSDMRQSTLSGRRLSRTEAIQAERELKTKLPPKLDSPSLKRVPDGARVKVRKPQRLVMRVLFSERPGHEYDDPAYMATVLNRITSRLAGMADELEAEGNPASWQIERTAWDAACVRLDIHWTARPPQALFDLVHAERIAIFGDRVLGVKPVTALSLLRINGLPTHATPDVPYTMSDLYAGFLNPTNTVRVGGANKLLVDEREGMPFAESELSYLVPYQHAPRPQWLLQIGGSGALVVAVYDDDEHRLAGLLTKRLMWFNGRAHTIDAYNAPKRQPQCMSCFVWTHVTSACKAPTQFCAHCSLAHLTVNHARECVECAQLRLLGTAPEVCPLTGEHLFCSNCGNTGHGPTSSRCRFSKNAKRPAWMALNAQKPFMNVQARREAARTQGGVKTALKRQRAAETKAANKRSAAAAKKVGDPEDAPMEDVDDDVVSYTDAGHGEDGDSDIEIFTGEASGSAT